jgi:hypothetical protein
MHGWLEKAASDGNEIMARGEENGPLSATSTDNIAPICESPESSIPIALQSPPNSPLFPHQNQFAKASHSRITMHLGDLSRNSFQYREGDGEAHDCSTEFQGDFPIIDLQSTCKGMGEPIAKMSSEELALNQARLKRVDNVPVNSAPTKEFKVSTSDLFSSLLDFVNSKGKKSTEDACNGDNNDNPGSLASNEPNNDPTLTLRSKGYADFTVGSISPSNRSTRKSHFEATKARLSYHLSGHLKSRLRLIADLPSKQSLRSSELEAAKACLSYKLDEDQIEARVLLMAKLKPQIEAVVRERLAKSDISKSKKYLHGVANKLSLEMSDGQIQTKFEHSASLKTDIINTLDKRNLGVAKVVSLSNRLARESKISCDGVEDVFPDMLSDDELLDRIKMVGSLKTAITKKLEECPESLAQLAAEASLENPQPSDSRSRDIIFSHSTKNISPARLSEDIQAWPQHEVSIDADSNGTSKGRWPPDITLKRKQRDPHTLETLMEGIKKHFLARNSVLSIHGENNGGIENKKDNAGSPPYLEREKRIPKKFFPTSTATIFNVETYLATSPYDKQDNIDKENEGYHESDEDENIDSPPDTPILTPASSTVSVNTLGQFEEFFDSKPGPICQSSEKRQEFYMPGSYPSQEKLTTGASTFQLGLDSDSDSDLSEDENENENNNRHHATPSSVQNDEVPELPTNQTWAQGNVETASRPVIPIPPPLPPLKHTPEELLQQAKSRFHLHGKRLDALRLPIMTLPPPVRCGTEKQEISCEKRNSADEITFLEEGDSTSEILLRERKFVQKQISWWETLRGMKKKMSEKSSAVELEALKRETGIEDYRREVFKREISWEEAQKRLAEIR